METFRLNEPHYEAARQELLLKYKTPRANCGIFTRVLAERFPELKRVAGFYRPPGGMGSHGEHWWLIDPAGNIIDPTADQFPSNGKGVYEPYDPKKHLVAKGTCPGCGMTLYAFASKPCSQECAVEVASEYGCRVSTGPFEAEMEFSCDADLTEKYGIKLDPIN